jgi:zinc D-Ala-D-Ala carboxypeptidase
VETRELPNGLGIDDRVYEDLMQMIEDGKAQEMSFVICSAYRSVEKQQELFDAEVADKETGGLSHDDAVAAAKTAVALPGTSEHNLGLAADIVAMEYQKLDEGFLNTDECKWLAENSWKYGFIMRYPEGKSDSTKIVFEPWHYRYVGKEAAAEIKEQGLCLEEYLGKTD